VLITEVSRVGVDINRLLDLRPLRAVALLQYVGGLGRNRASQVLLEGGKRKGFLRRDVLQEVLPPSVFRNAAGFLVVRPWHFDQALHIGFAKTPKQLRWADPEDYLQFHPLDITCVA
jgi:hypothetical protein